MKKITFLTEADVCSNPMIVEIDDDGIITNVENIGEYPGNSPGISAWLMGLKVDEAVRLLKVIKCDEKNSSCPAQFSNVLKQ